jgi:hypothetical protein
MYTTDLSHLHKLRLQDVTIDSEVMAIFLNRSQHLQTLSVFLSLSQPGLTNVPFSFNTSLETTLHSGILPNLEVLDLHPDIVRPILAAVPKPSSIRRLTLVEPCDWGADIPGDASGFMSPFGDHEKPPRPADVNTVKTGCITSEGMPNLCELTATRVERFAQIDQLVEVTPNLEIFRLHDSYIKELVSLRVSLASFTYFKFHLAHLRDSSH